MPVTAIHELRILPPLVIGRLGSSPDPMDNYDAEPDDDRGFRRLKPAETLVVEPLSGEIAGSATPSAVSFKDAQGRVKPVAPFLEVWARFDDDEENPAVIERSFGEGRVVMITTTADKEWHLWCDHPTFLPIMPRAMGEVMEIFPCFRSASSTPTIW